ncbi:MAG: hypothetical protein KAI76_05140 [Alphaproteobacteria bacterium]|nr:hypothetical protein [Alphaproteobacteria bacterium]
MAIFRLPLSGNVSQQINPWNFFTGLTSGQFGFVNINLGRSSAPEVEQEILESVGTYGRQLGKVCEAMNVLVHHIPQDANLNKEERKALDSFSRMVKDIEEVKESARKRYGSH